MDPNKYIEDMIKDPLNRSLIGHSSRRSTNLKTYFINIKSNKNSSKIFIKEDEVDYFTKIIKQANKDLANKKLLKKARENKEKLKKINEDNKDNEIEEVEEVEDKLVNDLSNSSDKEIVEIKEIEEIDVDGANDIVDIIKVLVKDNGEIEEGEGNEDV